MVGSSRLNVAIALVATALGAAGACTVAGWVGPPAADGLAWRLWREGVAILSVLVPPEPVAQGPREDRPGMASEGLPMRWRGRDAHGAQPELLTAAQAGRLEASDWGPQKAAEAGPLEVGHAGPPMAAQSGDPGGPGAGPAAGLWRRTDHAPILAAGPDAGGAAARAAAGATSAPAGGGDLESKAVLMSFKDTSIDSVLVLLSDLLDMSFVKDDAVVGTITIINKRRMTGVEAVHALEAALALKGFTLVKLSERVYQVLPAAKAAAKGMAVRTDREAEGGEHFVTRVVRLKNANPVTVLPVLEKLVAQEERVGPHPDSSSIVVSASSANADRLLSILEVLDQPASRGQMLELVTLKFLFPSQAQELVSRVFAGSAVTDPGAPPQPGTYRMVPVPGRGEIIVMAAPDRLAEIVGFIRRIDSPDLKDRPLRIYKLAVASAEKLAAFLQSMLAPGAAPAAREGASPVEARGGPLIVADTVTNSVMVIAGDEYQAMVARLIRQLDYEGFTSFRTHVFSLRHAKAPALAEELERIANRPGEADKGASAVVLVADRRLNRLIVSTASAARLTALTELIEALDQPGATEDLLTHVYYLSHAPARQIEKVLKELYAGRPGQTAGATGGGGGEGPETTSAGATLAATGTAGVPAGPIKVVADELTNSLVILSTQAAYEQMVKTLKQLDVDPLQVMVEVVIAEVQNTRGHTFGVDLAFTGAAGRNNIRTDFNKLNPDNTPDTALQGLRAFVITDDSFRALVHAFHENNNTNIIATPKLFANNNQEASILIGRQVPVITGRTVTTGGNTINTVEYKDVGTKLAITPQINRKRSVTLKLSQEVKTITGQGVENNPIIDTREAKTTATVAHGQAVVLGGLLQDEDTKGKRYVPGIGRVPFLRWLFGARERSVFKRELIFMFKPHVVMGSLEARAMSQDQVSRSVFRTQIKDDMPVSQVPYHRHRH